jgi:hypothetical protein
MFINSVHISVCATKERGQYMTNREEDKLALEKLPDGGRHYVNWFQDSGGLVYCVNHFWYVLFEEGCLGKSHFEGIYNRKDLDKLLDVAYSWT